MIMIVFIMRWFSPSCRADPSKCVPSVTANSWGFAARIQQAAVQHMPLAIATSSYADWARIGRLDTTFYWWQPDSTFVDLTPHFIVFPPYKPSEHSAGSIIQSCNIL